ncbi:MAG TPA: hypothetical protein PLU17_13285 [Chitinophagaceae bacterium]|nr:hypothetical protein [Chitinophagaceae bacterium]
MSKKTKVVPKREPISTPQPKKENLTLEPSHEILPPLASDSIWSKLTNGVIPYIIITVQKRHITII